VLGIVNSEIVKVTDENVQKEVYINTEVLGIVTVLISISFCTLSSVTFTISLLTIPNTSVLISISFCTLSSVTFTISLLTIYQYRSVRDS
jgi:hypothetical protein